MQTELTQSERVILVLKDKKRHSVPDINAKVYRSTRPTSARLAARIYDLKRRGYEIESGVHKDAPSIWWYRLLSGPKNVTVWRKKGGKSVRQ